jgi:heme-degrading monooxygenase HmoA
MRKLLIRMAAVFAVVVGGTASAQPSAQVATGAPGMVSVLIEVQLTSNTEPAAALVALNDMRSMMKSQPGYLSETFLQNLNPGNSPRYVHVSRWASMAYWAALFRTPEFSRLSAHGNEHYTISASAFVPAE